MSLGQVDWKEWSLLHRRLEPEQIASVRQGRAFSASGSPAAATLEDRVLYLDNLAVFTEAFQPLTFEPRPEAGDCPAAGSHHRDEHGAGPASLPYPRRRPSCPTT